MLSRPKRKRGSALKPAPGVGALQDRIRVEKDPSWELYCRAKDLIWEVTAALERDDVPAAKRLLGISDPKRAANRNRHIWQERARLFVKLLTHEGTIVDREIFLRRMREVPNDGGGRTVPLETLSGARWECPLDPAAAVHAIAVLMNVSDRRAGERIRAHLTREEREFLPPRRSLAHN